MKKLFIVDVNSQVEEKLLEKPQQIFARVCGESDGAYYNVYFFTTEVNGAEHSKYIENPEIYDTEFGKIRCVDGFGKHKTSNSCFPESEIEDASEKMIVYGDYVSSGYNINVSFNVNKEKKYLYSVNEESFKDYLITLN